MHEDDSEDKKEWKDSEVKSCLSPTNADVMYSTRSVHTKNIR